jgi:hypothetical protein
MPKTCDLNEGTNIKKLDYRTFYQKTNLNFKIVSHERPKNKMMRG